MARLNVVEATIDDLQAALSSGAITSVDLVARYLRRVSAYDCRGVSLNSIPVLNTSVFDEAAASDDRRVSGAPVRPLEGIPYTIKDSYKAKGMTVAAGSPAFRELVANEDAFTVNEIRKAGGVLIGRTNMPPMAYGGMQRGIYGRAESPYNLNYLAAGFASGSSNGSGVSTAASFAAFGMGEETVSSGRSPASNNALVAYTPSRGWISIRGNWPLYPTCDVVVPHTRTMKDMLRLLEVIAVDDAVTGGDFWRDQPFVKLPKPWPDGLGSLRQIESCTSLQGVRIAVPQIYIGGPPPPGAREVTTCDAVKELWQQAKKDLEALGAEILIVPDFPAVTAYENPSLLPDGCPRLPDDWNSAERGPLIAHAWNDFLQSTKDPKLPDILGVDGLSIYPDSMRTAPDLKQLDPRNAIHWTQLAEYIRAAPLYETKDLARGLSALEEMREQLLDVWLAENKCDCVVFPAAGDVGPADADVDDDGAAYAYRNGVLYSTGNRAIRHLGIPTVSIPMGIMEDKHMPVSLTFASRAYDDVNLLRWANAYEGQSHRRIAPPLTPPLESDTVSLTPPNGLSRAHRPKLIVKNSEVTPRDSEGSGSLSILIEGEIVVDRGEEKLPVSSPPIVEITVSSSTLSSEAISMERVAGVDEAVYRFKATASAPKPIQRDARSQTPAPVVRDSTMVVVLARSRVGGYPSGWLGVL
ncbi:Amidase signature enzyme [Pleurostoma richardsiae]|uniref:Amidase signature enzyme n=1 Tax=Pleurostoma richardsiae TaxID=41990 RepID=A0AA38VJT0_9PEZI|nr:Amidase signature enzyme [Pleurostoma richardsiae]